MSEVTVKQLAAMVGTPVERLLSQLKDAGISVTGEDASISEKEKMQLLAHLRRSHGKQEPAQASAPSRITLKRKTVSELRQPVTTTRSPGGVRSATAARTSGAAKTVSVEVRRKRTYVKRSEVQEDEQKMQDAEEARQALAEQAEQQRKAEEEAHALRNAQEAKSRENEVEQQAEEEARRKAEAEKKLQEEKKKAEAAKAAKAKDKK